MAGSSNPADNSRRPQCSWSQDQVRCPTAYDGFDDLIFEIGDGRYWCAFHRPAEAAEVMGFDEEFMKGALYEYILQQARRDQRILLPGFHIPWDLQLSQHIVLERPAEEGWSASVRTIDLRGCEIIGDLAISGVGGAAVDILAHDITVDGKIEIGGSEAESFGHIDLSGARVSGDITLAGDRSATSAERASTARRITLDSLKIARRVAIRHLTIAATLTANDARVSQSLEVANCTIDPTPGPRSRRFGDVLSDAIRAAIEIGVPAKEDDKTNIGTLVIDDCELRGSLSFLPNAARNLQLSRTRVDGLVETGGMAIPEHAMILDFAMGLAFAVRDKPARFQTRRITGYHQHQLARFRRSFRIVRASVHGLEQTARLVRQERATVSAIDEVDLITRAIWLGHEFFTASGESWRYPIAVLMCNAILFVSLLAYCEPTLTTAQAVAISTTNSIAPFLSLQSIVEKTSLSSVLLSVLQSAVTAILLSSIYLSLRAKIED